MGFDCLTTNSRPSGVELASALMASLEDGHLHLNFQPKVCLRSGGQCGAEALIRWTHPVFGPISPAEFIPVAEETGVIGSIGQWVLDESCALIAQARDTGVFIPRLAVNVSARELLEDDLSYRILASTRRHGISPEQLEIEVTETAVISDPTRAVAALTALRDQGISVAVDDFGTGYSSLAYLKRLPLDVLKLDRSFVADIDESPVDRRIVRTVVALGHTLGLKVVAEGVERQSQASLLTSCRVDVAQGFHFARPLAGPAFLQWMRNAAPCNHSCTLQ